MDSKIIRYSLGFLILFMIITAITISKFALMVMSVIFIILAIKEYREMFKAKDIDVLILIPEFIGIILSFLFIYDYQNWVTPILVFGIFLSCLFTIVRNKKPYMPVVFSTIMGFIFIFCSLYIVKLFYFMEHPLNLRLIFTYIAAVMAGDFSASRIGPLNKKYLLSPEISPNKTILGSIVNLIACCIICSSMYPIYPIHKLIYLGIIISVSSQIGDLTISMIKRDLGIKHSGNIFLNYGGILDRVDAFIFSAPCAYYYLFFITYLFK